MVIHNVEKASAHGGAQNKESWLSFRPDSVP